MLEIASGRHGQRPMTFVRATADLMLGFDGLGRPIRWDGFGPAHPAGLLAPTSVITFPAIPPAGTLTVVGVVAVYRYLDRDGYASNPTLASAEVSITNGKIVYQGLVAPQDSRVTTVQIFRTLSETDDGVAFLDLEFPVAQIGNVHQSETSDEAISANTRIAIVGVASYLDDPPPASKAIAAAHRGRIFAAVERSIGDGHLEATNGSAVIRGIGTSFVDALAGRKLYARGASKAYTLASVQGASQITLTEPWVEPSSSFIQYSIDSSPYDKRAIAYSEAGLPESWPPENSLSLQETEDEISALISWGLHLYIVEQSNIHRLAYDADPATSIAQLLVRGRGCINHRSWVIGADNGVWMLDRYGIYRYDGARGMDHVSTPINDIWADGLIDFRYAEWIHAAHFPKEEIVRWFVPFGPGLPRHTICYQYRLKRWWVEEYPVPILATTLAKDGRVYAASSYGRILSLSDGYHDGLREADIGAAFGSVVSAGVRTLTAAADWPADAVGLAIDITSGRGKGQRRIIAEIDGATATVTDPWLIEPDSDSLYTLGGIAWHMRTGKYQWVINSNQVERDIAVWFTPQSHPMIADLTIYHDHKKVGEMSPLNMELDGVRAYAGQPAKEFDLHRDDGFVYFKVSSRSDRESPSDRLVSMSLSGVTVRERVRMNQIDIGGAVADPVPTGEEE